MKVIKTIGFISLLFLAIPFVLLYLNHSNYQKVQDKSKKEFLTNSNNRLPSFKRFEAPFSHQYNDAIAMPFLDIETFVPFKSKQTYIFQTGGAGQKNIVLEYQNDTFEDVASILNLEGISAEAAYCFAFEDLNGDGLKEVITGYASGIYIQEQDTTSFRYGEMKKIADIPDISIPVDIAVADTRNRGLNDLYVTTFVDKQNFSSATYHDFTKKRQNLYLVNNGDATFTEQSKKVGLELIQNSYFAEFVDLDKDGFKDLVLALNTDVGKIYKNNGDGTWLEKRLPIEYGFWMGLAIDEIKENDDNVHILMSNIGNSFPEWIVRGDLEDDEIFESSYVLLEQVDGFEFKNVTKEKNLFSNVFGWNVIFTDLNNDQRKDAILTENYINFPLGFHHSFPSDGKVFFQDESGTFAPFQSEVGIINPYFAFRVIAHDFTGNGYKDVIFGNIGGPVSIFLNQGL